MKSNELINKIKDLSEISEINSDGTYLMQDLIIVDKNGRVLKKIETGFCFFEIDSGNSNYTFQPVIVMNFEDKDEI